MVTTYWVGSTGCYLLTGQVLQDVTYLLGIGFTGCYLLTAKLSTGIMKFLEKSVGTFSMHKIPFTHSVVYRTLLVMEFQDQGYKIRKVFAEKSTYPKEIIEF